MRPQATFSSFFYDCFLTTYSFFHSPPRSFLLAPPSPSFLLVPLSCSSVTRHHLEFVKVHFSSIDESITDQPTDGPNDGRSDRNGKHCFSAKIKKPN